MAMRNEPMRTLTTLDEVIALVRAMRAAGRGVYVRYSLGPAVDGRTGQSRDHQTGELHAGLSANNLFCHDGVFTDGDPVYVEMQLAEYASLLAQGLDGTRAWLLTGREVGRDSDNAPLLTDVEPLAWVAEEAINAAVRNNIARANEAARARRYPLPYAALVARDRATWDERLQAMALAPDAWRAYWVARATEG